MKALSGFILLLSVMTAQNALASNQCDQEKAIAKEAMFSRQNGLEIDRLKSALKTPDTNLSRRESEELADLTIKILDEAYKTPVQERLSMQYLATQDFSLSVFHSCLNGNTSKTLRL